MSAFPGDDASPLTERERRQLNRLLSDPTVYPMTLKAWLVPFLEGSDMDLPMSAVHGLQARLNDLSTPPLARMPSGTVLLFEGDEAPEGTEFIEEPPPTSLISPASATTSALRYIRVL